MEIFSGTLNVEEIHGRRGKFCVATLHTSIGDFKVKDPALDQFSPGQYKGRFMVESIFASSESWRGGIFTALRARICTDGFLIEEQSDLAADDDVPMAQVEPDPLDATNPPVAPPLTATPTTDAPDAPTVEGMAATQGGAVAPDPEGQPEAATAPTADDLDIKLFGFEIGPAFTRRESIIRLDTTVDRVLFRAQRNCLKEAGYRFDPQTQQWRL